LFFKTTIHVNISPLLGIFRYFAAASDHKTKMDAIIEGTSEMKLDDESSEKSSLLSYNDFLRFCNNFDVAKIGLSTFDIGDIYLGLVGLNQSYDDDHIQKIDFDNFMMILQIFSCRAFKSAPKIVSQVDKLKGMFLYMWNNIRIKLEDDNLIANDVTNRGEGFDFYKQDYIKSCRVFSERVQAAWERDNHRDYFDPKVSLNCQGISNSLAL
jgi:hypothetical protein